MGSVPRQGTRSHIPRGAAKNKKIKGSRGPWKLRECSKVSFDLSLGDQSPLVLPGISFITDSFPQMPYVLFADVSFSHMTPEHSFLPWNLQA